MAISSASAEDCSTYRLFSYWGKARHDDSAPALAGATYGDLLDRFVFGGNRVLVNQAHVAGRLRVADGRHHDREPVARRYAQAMRQLLED